ncbi:hypothetical protein AF332_13260 [Sporosarcina globispora]|uniref:Uncharacterized protein n=1 Tax=Sporosarcina globispora TaxID=1459 RepID=A0A0M0GCR6_SPOGL|nr:hypothetical protein [Sporosarcina globispora]KON87705.1 hypothetical protein AF332_13260 [Sporosarcina globispora]
MKKTIIGLSITGLLLAGGYGTTVFAADAETSADNEELSWNFKSKLFDHLGKGFTNDSESILQKAEELGIKTEG